MTNKQARRLLLVALVVSLLVHTLIAARLPWPLWRTQSDVQIEHISHIRLMHVTKQPTPPPQTASPNPSPAVSAKPTKPGNGTAPARVANAATAPPTPAASATPNCAKADTAAEMTVQPDIDLSKDASLETRGQGKSGTTTVLVKVDPNGAVADATVQVSSGSPSLDLVAIAEAKKASYSPATHDCKAIASEVAIQVPFTAW